MLKCILCIGAPGAGKSFWAKAEVAKDPNNVVRVNNDDIRSMLNDSVFSPATEKLVSRIRENIIHNALKYGKSVIVDNVNSNKEHFETCVAIAKSLNKDILVTEKPFYEELSVLMERDSKREGKGRVGEIIVKKFFNALGGKQFKNYQPRSEIFAPKIDNDVAISPKYNPDHEDAVICDLDGSLAIINNRSPYNATDCDLKDLPNLPVVETVLAHYKAGKQIIFCSGREDKYAPETIKFIEKYCRYEDEYLPCPNCEPPQNKIEIVINYKLYMRKSGDFRKDFIIKEEIYNEHIKDKVNVLLVLDDRTSVVNLWRSLGLTCFQVAPGDF